MDTNINAIGASRIVNAFNQQFRESISLLDLDTFFPRGFERLEPLHPQCARRLSSAQTALQVSPLKI
ncbi:hypothetical protein BM613_10970 [Sulfoacidibacillus thermotolerans]|uniref:Uncharacterized protein n=1 Tax=Sulfoacidibacillus thermotolerans TaxID=1765684 RepID=A0A2U3D6T4_SULT2|nr:hypothetical protein BM613_10970 [Sulfoacidibacillus thermotolerans]